LTTHPQVAMASTAYKAVGKPIAAPRTNNSLPFVLGFDFSVIFNLV
jgi:hypothetical protein